MSEVDSPSIEPMAWPAEPGIAESRHVQLPWPAQEAAVQPEPLKWPAPQEDAKHEAIAWPSLAPASSPTQAPLRWPDTEPLGGARPLSWPEAQKDGVQQPAPSLSAVPWGEHDGPPSLQQPAIGSSVFAGHDEDSQLEDSGIAEVLRELLAYLKRPVEPAPQPPARVTSGPIQLLSGERR